MLRLWKHESPSWKAGRSLQQKAGRSGSRPPGPRPTGRTVPRRNAGIGPTALPGAGRSPPTEWSTPRPVVRTAGHWLLGGRVRGGRQIISIPRCGHGVTEHVVLECTCRKCGQRWSPEADWSALVVGRQQVGISVRQEVCVLREECRLPYGVIQRHLKWRCRLCLSVGELVALVRGVVRLGQEEYKQLQQEIRASPVVYGDETGWREAGRNGYLRSFSNPGSALLPPPGQPGQQSGCGGVGG